MASYLVLQNNLSPAREHFLKQELRNALLFASI